MPNQFTGDFDVVAECSMPAANRVIAAMQRMERFPHSLTLHVDDKQRLHPPLGPAVVGVVDAFGDATVNHRRIGPLGPISGGVVGTSATLQGFDAIVNTDVVGATEGPITPSALSGTAQLQLSPPTIEIADAAGSTIRVRMTVMARYFADPGTTALPEFIRGELSLTTPIAQTLSQLGTVVEVDIKASAVQVSFAPAWSSGPLTPENIAGIEQLVRNALRTAVLPSNVPLPATIQQAAFKALGAPVPALAMALRLRPGTADPGGANSDFLSGGDDFAIAIGADYVKSVLQPMADSILAQPVLSATLSYSVPFYTFHIPYTFTLASATFTLEPGTIVLTVTGHAHTPRTWMPDFDFTVRFPFSLVPDGATVNLVPGTVSLDTSSWVVNLFRDAAASGMTTVRDQSLADSGANTTVRHALDAQAIIGVVLDELLAPASGRLRPILPHRPQTSLAYSGVGISDQGIVLHGRLGVVQFPQANVEFEEIPADGGNRVFPAGILQTGPDYSALKSWIPGGAIRQYEWSRGSASQQGSVDDNKFVYLQGSPAVEGAGVARSTLVSAFTPMCLTVRGTRLSATGPVTSEQVTGSVCGYSAFPVVSNIRLDALTSVPMLAVLHPNGTGVHVVGHTAAGGAELGRRTPNTVVHFARDGSLDAVGAIVKAVEGAGRSSAPTAILVIAPRGTFDDKSLPGQVLYAEDDPAWNAVYEAQPSKSNETVIAGPDGRVHWRQPGPVSDDALVAALRKYLVPATTPHPVVLAATARLGHAPPNFLFEHAPGKQITLRKVAGHPTTIVFWRAASSASIDAVLAAEKEAAATRAMVLAVNDGDSRDVALRTAKQRGFSAIVVTDQAREIASGYGVRIWPTVVSIDSLGIMNAISYARVGRRTDGGGDKR